MVLPWLPFLLVANVGGRALTWGAVLESFPAEPTPTRTAVPPARREVDPMAALSWLQGRWAVQGTWMQRDVEGVHEWSTAYGGRTFFFHAALHERGRPNSGVFESHAALGFDPARNEYVLIASDSDGSLWQWRATRQPEQILEWKSPRPLNRTALSAQQWTVRRTHTDEYTAFAEGGAPFLLSGRLIR